MKWLTAWNAQEGLPLITGPKEQGNQNNTKEEEERKRGRGGRDEEKITNEKGIGAVASSQVQGPNKKWSNR